MLNDLLVEIGTEELPSGSVWPLVDRLRHNLVNALREATLSHGRLEVFATPRRLAVLVHDLPAKPPSQRVVRRGPALASAYNDQGQPTPALVGFAKSCQVCVDALTTLTTEKGEWKVYESVVEGTPTRDLLPTLVQGAIQALPISKPMRWGEGSVEFARPVHWVVLLLGEEPVPCTILGVTADRYTRGHRFHAPAAIKLRSPSAYESTLEQAFVIPDFAKRRNMIVEQVNALALSHQGSAVMPEALVDEVTSIVEWPQALVAQFDEAFLEIPSEVLIAAMQSHQKCFPLRDKNDQLLPRFITVANIASTAPEHVVRGNEKVIRARLSDAAFFFQQDKKTALSACRERTAQVVFQAKLGSLFDKAVRIETLMTALVHPLQLNEQDALRAAMLSKCDLMTGMVGEFPELQGLMGYYYALHDQETPGVAQALFEQYLPRFAGDSLPQTALGLALSLADRLDTLVGAFAMGQKPTGVKDPFKLRRHALAVVRLLLVISTPVTLSTLIAHAAQGLEGTIRIQADELSALQPFILERMLSYYQGQGIAPEVVHAVRRRQEDWLFDTDKRIKALVGFVQLPEATALAAACKRVNNLLQQATSLGETDTLQTTLLIEPAEKALYAHLEQVESTILPWYTAGQYPAILQQLAHLREPVDAFFDQVMVMVDDPLIRHNRLYLLRRLQRVLQGVADISLLP